MTSEMNAEMRDRVLADWISEGPSRGPAQGLARALTAVHAVEQRPAWMFPRRWLPKSLAAIELHVPSYVTAAILLALLILALVALSIGVGSMSRPTIRTLLGVAGDNYIAFSDSSGVALSRADGSNRLQLASELAFARSPVFAPTGDRVAVVVPAAANETTGRLFVASVAGQQPAVEIGSGHRVAIGDTPSITWSPDSRRLAFAAVEGDRPRIYVSDVEGGGLTALTDGTSTAELPAWSPDGQWIAYRETVPDGVHVNLMKIHPDGSGLELMSAIVAADGHMSAVRWAPDDGSLLYALNPGFGSSTSAVIDLGFGHMITVWAEGVGGLEGAGLAWSPDGQRIAVITERDGVIVADDDDSAPQYDGSILHLGDVAACFIDWAPDGTALYGASPNGCASVVVIPLADPSQTITLPGSGAGAADWQPLR